MKNNKIAKSLLLTIASFTIGSIYNNLFGEIGIAKYQPDEYKNTCFTAYHWDQDGNTWILLGKEKRGYRLKTRHRGRSIPESKSRIKWFDFCGSKEPQDKNSWETSVREASEETAGQLNFSKGMTFTHRGERNRHTIHYIAPVQYVDPHSIAQAAKKLRKKGHGKSIEKLEWRWVKLQDLLDGTTGLSLYWSLKDKLKNFTIKKFLKTLIEKGKSFVISEKIVSEEIA